MSKKLLLLFAFSLSLFTRAEVRNLNDSIVLIDEVVVEGVLNKKPKIARMDVPLGFIPASISSINTDLLFKRGIYDLPSIAPFFPGITVDLTYGGFAQIASRGFDHTPIMIDGIRDERTSINNSYPFPSLASIQSIELLKGPASVLYGHSTIGGIFNVVRKAPVDKTTLNARLAYGSWNSKQATLEFGDKIARNLNMISVINWSNRTGYRNTQDEELSAYFAFDLKMTEKQNLELRLGAANFSTAADCGLPALLEGKDGKLNVLPNVKHNWRYSNDNDFVENKNFNAMLTYTNRFSKHLVLENKAAYMYDDINYMSTENPNYLSGSDNKKVILNSNFAFAYNVHTVSNQLSLSGIYNLANIKNHYTIGSSTVAFLRNHNKANVFGTGVDVVLDVEKEPMPGGRINTQSFRSVASMQNYSQGFYVQNLTELHEKFKFLLSGRYDYYRNYFRPDKPNPTGKRITDVFAGGERSLNADQAFSYRAGVVFLPKPNISIYSSISNFFAPHVSQRSSTMVYFDKNGKQVSGSKSKLFEPLYGYQIDLGLRYSYEDLFQFTASVFNIDKKNEAQRIDKDITNDPTYDGIKHADIQLGASVSRGLEAELLVTPTRESRFTLSYAYVDAHISKIADVSKMSGLEGFRVTNIKKGARLARVPKHSLTATGYYMFTKGFLKNADLNFAVNYRSDFSQTLSDEIMMPGRCITNVGASFPIVNSGVRVGLMVNNLFNLDYYERALESHVMPADPRNFMFSLSYQL